LFHVVRTFFLIAPRQDPAALKLCKAVKNVEEREVSCRRAEDFHKLINTCVENLTAAKYFFLNSVFALLPGGFDRCEMKMIQFKIGRA
jgi:hypothetical protein